MKNNFKCFTFRNKHTNQWNKYFIYCQATVNTQNYNIICTINKQGICNESNLVSSYSLTQRWKSLYTDD